MSPQSACPRCRTLVAYAVGVAPTCHACGFGAPAPVPPQPATAAPGSLPTWTEPALVQPPRTSGKAVASMVIGICGLIFYPLGLILGIIALVLGLLARNAIRTSNGAVGGAGMAVTGIVLGVIGAVVGTIVLGAIVFVLVAEAGASEQAAVVLLSLPH